MKAFLALLFIATLAGLMVGAAHGVTWCLVTIGAVSVGAVILPDAASRGRLEIGGRTIAYDLVAYDPVDFLERVARAVGGELDLLGAHVCVDRTPGEDAAAYRERVRRGVACCRRDVHVLGEDPATWARCQCGRSRGPGAPRIPNSHASHGRGTAEAGPHDSDCPCRTNNARAECAAAGCGFCIVAEENL